AGQAGPARGPDHSGSRLTVTPIRVRWPAAAGSHLGDPDRVRDHPTTVDPPPADRHHVGVSGGQGEDAEAHPLPTAAALVDVDGLVAAGGGHNVRGAVVVVPVRREP